MFFQSDKCLRKHQCFLVLKFGKSPIDNSMIIFSLHNIFRLTFSISANKEQGEIIPEGRNDLDCCDPFPDILYIILYCTILYIIPVHE